MKGILNNNHTLKFKEKKNTYIYTYTANKNIVKDKSDKDFIRS